MRRKSLSYTRRREQGVTLIVVAFVLVGLLAVAALAVDLGTLYVARNEAQRSADAAALAGAYVFVTSGCTSAASGCVAGGSQETIARQQAEAVGDTNYVAGQSPNIQDTDISFSYPTSEEPQITVTVERTGIQTIFARMFGVSSSSVEAKAVAEAYSPTGSDNGISLGCTAPFLVPNCDTSRTTGVTNPNCPTTADYFINTSANPPSLENPGVSPTGVIGSTWQLHFGTTGPSSSDSPSQWYLIAFGTSQSGAQLEANIQDCSPTPVACGQTIDSYDGKSVGPVDDGVEARIHASGLGMGQGQDAISTTTGPPFQITGGTNNPVSALVGQTYYGPSDSIITVPVYDGQTLSSGGSTVTVRGYMQMFIEDVEHSGGYDVVNAVILGITACGGTPSNGGTGLTVDSPAGAPVPIRLIHQ